MDEFTDNGYYADKVIWETILMLKYLIFGLENLLPSWE